MFVSKDIYKRAEHGFVTSNQGRKLCHSDGVLRHEKRATVINASYCQIQKNKIHLIY